MTLDDLLSDAYSLGTGISRPTALKSQRYKELVTSFPKLPYLKAEQTAEMALLGEKLAERAFLTLPANLRTKAKQWTTYSESEQVELLHELKETLGDKSLAHRRRGQCTRPLTPEHKVLPHQYKSWARNPARVSCLGLAQMLIGFGQATGAPCLLVDILLPHHIHVAQFQYLRLYRLEKLLDTYTKDEYRFKRFRRIIKNSMKSTLAILASERDTQQAHHALAIKAGSDWWVIDPYFDTIMKMRNDTEAADRDHARVHKSPRSTGTENNRLTRKQVAVDFRLKILEKSLPYLQRLHEPRSSWSYIDVSLSALVSSNIPYKALGTQEGDEQYAEAISNGVILTLCTPRRVRSFVRNNPDAEVTGLIGSCKRLATSSKRYRNQAHLRTMHQLVRECLIDIVQLPNERALAKKQEFSHPTFQLAVRTINQLALVREIDVPELSLYSSGQWILHDTFNAVERSSSKRLQRIAKARISLFTKNPEFALPEISHLLESA